MQFHHVMLTVSEERDLTLEPVLTGNFQHIVKCISVIIYNCNGVNVILRNSA